MKLVIDLDLHEAIQDFAIRAPANVYDFKSQDTIDWLVYFVRSGIVQDAICNWHRENASNCKRCCVVIVFLVDA